MVFVFDPDDGVLSHKEFIVVMKNQLVRGLENVNFDFFLNLAKWCIFVNCL